MESLGVFESSWLVAITYDRIAGKCFFHVLAAEDDECPDAEGDAEVAAGGQDGNAGEYSRPIGPAITSAVSHVPSAEQDEAIGHSH